jgi:molybdate transport system substrate-binding protein
VTALKILSAGAAQAVVETISAAYTRDTGREVKGEFSAVGAMKARVVAGEAVDVVLLTAALIDELIQSGHVVAGSRSDLGKVGTGIAVRAGVPTPNVSSAQALRAALQAASVVTFPDPAVATAGKVVMQVCEKLGVADEVKRKMKLFPNGYAAMKWLAGTHGDEIGITQITEILANRDGVTYVGPLPGDLQSKSVYSAGLAVKATQAAAGKEFIARLTSPGAKAILKAAGYEFD